jgi:hypothetical protein
VATLWWFPASSDPGTGKTAVVFQTRIILFHWHNKALQMSTHVITARASEQFYVQYKEINAFYGIRMEENNYPRQTFAVKN